MRVGTLVVAGGYLGVTLKDVESRNQTTPVIAVSKSVGSGYADLSFLLRSISLASL